MHLDLEAAGCFFNEANSCPLINNEISKQYLGYDYEYQTCTNKFTFKMCKKCNMLLLDPRPKPIDLNVIYPSNYHSYILAKENKKTFNITFFRKKAALSRFRNGYKIIENGKGKTRILDIGCGNGWMLDVLKDEFGDNVETYGTEINETVCKEALKKGHCVMYGLDPYELFKKEKFDIINITHVIEHLSNPFSLVQNCFKLLKNNGILIIETPNFQSVDKKIIDFFNEGSWGGFHFPRHWYLFCEKAVKNMTERINGLKLEKITYFPSPTTWIWSMNNLIQNKKKYKLALFDPVKIFQNSGLSFLAMLFFYLLDKAFCLMKLRTSTFQFVLRKVS